MQNSNYQSLDNFQFLMSLYDPVISCKLFQSTVTYLNCAEISQEEDFSKYI